MPSSNVARTSGARLRVFIRNEGPHLELCIEDEGPGMPFEPRAEGLQPGPSTKRFGTGLGIPFAYKVCTTHGWELTFDPVESGGTRVVISVPRQV
jgi:signal transduction histidine kinase